MRIPFLTLMFVLVPFGALAAVGGHVWSGGWSSTGAASPDGTGHVALSGSFFSAIDLGGGTFTPGNVFGGDVFLARFDASGNHVWSVQYTPGGFGFTVDAVAAAPDGSIYLAGTLQNGDIDFGGGVLSGNGEVVLAGFAPDGAHRFSTVVGPGFVQALDAGDDTVALTGYTYGAMDFGGGPLAWAGDADCFVAMLRPDGSHRWSAGFGDASGQGGMGLAVAPDQGVVLAATSESDVDFGGGLLAVAGTDLCLASFDSTGTHEWSFPVAGDFSPGSGILATLDVAVAGDGRVAVAGQFNGGVDFGGGNLSAYGSDDAFLALFDATGAHLASQRYGGTSSDGAQGVGFDSSGHVVLAGNFLSANADFGGAPVTHSGGFGSDWFATAFDDTGTHLWREVWTGNGQWSLRAEFDGTDRIFLSGSGGGGQDFGGGALATSELFVAVLEGAGGSTAAPALAASARLGQNRPNPFNPSTTIAFELALPVDRAVLSVHDARGRLVSTLHAGPLGAGLHTRIWTGRDRSGRSVASGTYFYRLVTPERVLVRKMSLVR